MPSVIDIPKPDDWHVHLRDGVMLQTVLPDTARDFGRALVMPNLRPPASSTAEVAAYRARILAALPEGMDFEPRMAAYLTEGTDAEDLARGALAGVISAVKLYPANATTNSAHGVRDLARVDGVLARMAELGLPLCVHGEVTESAVDVFDREAVFCERVLAPLLGRHPTLRVVLEHVTTEEGLALVRAHAGRVAATITVHHLLLNRSDLFDGGLRPHHYCLPVAKRERHRVALVEAALSGEGCFFLGTDSAPHVRSAKESSCGCAGLYTAPVAMPLLAALFVAAGHAERLAGFASEHGARYYGLPVSQQRLVLESVPDQAPAVRVAGQEGEVVIFRGGERLPWRVRRAVASA